MLAELSCTESRFKRKDLWNSDLTFLCADPCLLQIFEIDRSRVNNQGTVAIDPLFGEGNNHITYMLKSWQKRWIMVIDSCFCSCKESKLHINKECNIMAFGQ